MDRYVLHWGYLGTSPGRDSLNDISLAQLESYRCSRTLANPFLPVLAAITAWLFMLNEFPVPTVDSE